MELHRFVLFASRAARSFSLASLLILITTSLSAQSILIDDFSTDQTLLFAVGAGSTTSSLVTTAGSDILGGERDLELRVAAGAVVSAEVTAGIYNFSVAAATTGEGLLAWDGPDGLPDSADLDASGLGGVDLTSSGSQDALQLFLVSSDQPGTVTMTIYTDAANFSTFTQATSVTAMPLIYSMPLADFVIAGGTGADFTNVGAITMFKTGTEIDARFDLLRTTSLISATKADVLLLDTNFDGMVGAGDTVRYTVTLDNPDDEADAAADGIMFSSSVDANTSLVVGSVTTSQGTVTTGNTAGDTSVAVDVGTLADGASVTLTFDVLVNNPVPMGVTQIACQGLVTSDVLTGLPTDDPDDPTGNTDPTVTPIVAPVLTASKTDGVLIDTGVAGAGPGDTLRYTVTLNNTGTSSASAVTFSNPAVANTTLVVGSVTTSQGTVTTGNTAGDTTIAVDVGTLPPMGMVTIMFDVLIEPLPAGVTELTCQGTITGTNFTSLPTDDPDVIGTSDPTLTPVGGAPDLAISKDDGGATTAPGGTVSYTLSYANNGNQDATGVVLTETVPANSTFNAGASTAGWACMPDASAGSTCTLSVGSLAVSASGMVTFTVDVDDPLAVGVTQISNTASIDDDGTNGPDPTPVDNSDNDTTPVIRPATPILEAEKILSMIVDDDGNGMADPGETLAYEVSVTNLGPGTALGVVFTDTPDANTALVNGSVSTSQGTVTVGNGAGDATIEIDLGDLVDSQTVTITYQVAIDDPLPDGVTTILNQGLVTGTNVSDVVTDDMTTSDPDDPTVVVIFTTPVIDIPTLDPLGLAMLALLLLMLARRKLQNG